MKLKRRDWLVGGAALGALAAGAWVAQREAAPEHPSVEAFWGQTFERPQGGSLSPAAWRGQLLLVNFWATWCAPCVEEMPLLDRFFRTNAANGWQVLGLAVDQPAAVQKFLLRTPVSFPIGLAGLEGVEWVKRLGNPGGGLPFSVLMDRSGKAVQRKIGRLEMADLLAWHREQVHG